MIQHVIKCYNCNKAKNINKFKRLREGNARYCYSDNCIKCDDKIRNLEITARKEKIANRKKKLIKPKLLKQKYKQYKYSAVKRGYLFKLTIEQFNSFYQQNCYYCGEKVKTIGIDRLNNNIGYQMNNCVPCCSTCNRMKLSMEGNDFLQHIFKIFGHHFRTDADKIMDS